MDQGGTWDQGKSSQGTSWGPGCEVWIRPRTGDQGRSWGHGQELGTRVGAGDQIISINVINIPQCHHHLHHSDEVILYVAEGSFRVEEMKEDGRQHRQP